MRGFGRRCELALPLATRSSARRRALAITITFTLGVAVAAVAPRTAFAHFNLLAPPSWRTQDIFGNPQKAGPCGDEGAAATTAIVTAFAPGDTITIMLDETIYHPGHYRIALAVNDRSELPEAPPVTPGTTDCGSALIMAPAVFPVVADGVLAHDTPFTGTQSIQVTLPSDITCTHCTLQVLEFMSDHGAPCFYHHCADLSITAPPVPCESDADCADADLCTEDACDPVGACAFQQLRLADATPAYLGTLAAPACSTEPVPRMLGALFAKAGTLVTRAAGDPAKATRLLAQATNRLRRAGKKVGRISGHRVTPACATALGAILDRAKERVACLRAP